MKAVAIAVEPSVRFEQLVQAHQREVWRYLRFLGASAAEADDLTQETFLEVWRKPFVEHNERASAAYLRTVARNRFLMGVRSRGRKPRLLSTSAVRGMMNAMDVFQEMVASDEEVDRPDLLVSFDEVNKLVGYDTLTEMEERYAAPGN